MFFRMKRESNARKDPESFVKVEDNCHLPLIKTENQLAACQVSA